MDSREYDVGMEESGELRSFSVLRYTMCKKLCKGPQNKGKKVQSVELQDMLCY